MAESTNYPDLLGYITGGQRCNIGAAQVAAAVRPRIVHAGKPFEIILLVQNAIEDDIDVTMAIRLPGVDARKQPERFIGKTNRLVVTVKGGEVGTIVLPVTTLPDTAISDSYRIGVDIDVRPLGKGERIRAVEGGGKIELDRLTPETRAAIESLKTLAFQTERRRNLIEVPLTVMSGSVGKMTDFTPGWVSVAKVSDYHDNRLLLHRYGGTVQVNTLPKLKRAVMFAPLLETTKTRFSEAGYPLHDGEATAIAKLMTLVLEYATPRYNAHDGIAARNFDVEALIMRDPFSFDTPPTFPYWFSSFIATLERDERAAIHPAQVIPRYLYDDLLRDAVNLAFDLVVETTGEDMGGEEERSAYCEQLIARLTTKSELDFGRVYLPLVIGGLLINDQFILPKEDPTELLRSVSAALEGRSADVSAADQAIFAMTRNILARTGQRYGLYHLGK